MTPDEDERTELAIELLATLAMVLENTVVRPQKMEI